MLALIIWLTHTHCCVRFVRKGKDTSRRRWNLWFLFVTVNYEWRWTESYRKHYRRMLWCQQGLEPNQIRTRTPTPSCRLYLKQPVRLVNHDQACLYDRSPASCCTKSRGPSTWSERERTRSRRCCTRTSSRACFAAWRRAASPRPAASTMLVKH